MCPETNKISVLPICSQTFLDPEVKLQVGSVLAVCSNVNLKRIQKLCKFRAIPCKILRQNDQQVNKLQRTADLKLIFDHDINKRVKRTPIISPFYTKKSDLESVHLNSVAKNTVLGFCDQWLYISACGFNQFRRIHSFCLYGNLWDQRNLMQTLKSMVRLRECAGMNQTFLRCGMNDSKRIYS